MSSSLTPLKVAVLLAAGEGKRMGFPKGLLALPDGRSVLGRLAAFAAAAGYHPLIILGADAEVVAKHHPGLDWVVNTAWEDGQFSSVRLGLNEALRRGASHVLVHPADVPALEARVIRALEQGIDGSHAAVPEYKGKPGHPALLTADAAQAVLASSAPHLRAALAQLQAGHVAVDDPGILDDVDTPEAYTATFQTAPRRLP
jgi:molybdenum cofactor cytidylyltransferase